MIVRIISNFIHLRKMVTIELLLIWKAATGGHTTALPAGLVACLANAQAAALATAKMAAVAAPHATALTAAVST